MLGETPKTQRVVITPDGLISALQGKLQQAAEKAVQAAVARQVREALSSIDDLRNSSVREIQELVPTREEGMELSSKQQFAALSAPHWKKQMEKPPAPA